MSGAPIQELQWSALYKRFPGALPSQLLKEDIAMLTRPFIAGDVARLMAIVQAGDMSALSESEAQMIEPIMQAVKLQSKRQELEKLRRESHE